MDGNGDGNYKDNDLSSAQESAIASAYHGAIVANRGRDLSGFGKRVSGTASAEDQAMTRVASQFVGKALVDGGGRLSGIWKSIPSITANADQGMFSGGLYPFRGDVAAMIDPSTRHITITGSRGGWFNRSMYNPSDIVRLLFHEPRHFLNGGLYLPMGPHARMDYDAIKQLKSSGMAGGGCQAIGGLLSCD